MRSKPVHNSLNRRLPSGIDVRTTPQTLKPVWQQPGLSDSLSSDTVSQLINPTQPNASLPSWRSSLYKLDGGVDAARIATCKRYPAFNKIFQTTGINPICTRLGKAQARLLID